MFGQHSKHSKHNLTVQDVYINSMQNKRTDSYLCGSQIGVLVAISNPVGVHHGVTFSFCSAKVCSLAIFKTFFSFDKDIWIAATDYYTYFYIIVLFSIDIYSPVNKCYSVINFSLLINAVILILNCLILILYVYIHFLSLRHYFLYLNII